MEREAYEIEKLRQQFPRNQVKNTFLGRRDELPNAFYCSVNLIGEETGQDLQEKSLIIKGDLRELGE